MSVLLRGDGEHRRRQTAAAVVDGGVYSAGSGRCKRSRYFGLCADLPEPPGRARSKTLTKTSPTLPRLTVSGEACAPYACLNLGVNNSPNHDDDCCRHRIVSYYSTPALVFKYCARIVVILCRFKFIFIW